jgi:hypothetical protein
MGLGTMAAALSEDEGKRNSIRIKIFLERPMNKGR